MESEKNIYRVANNNGYRFGYRFEEGIYKHLIYMYGSMLAVAPKDSFKQCDKVQ